MSAWSDAFAELVRLVQPDLDPALTKGLGATADLTKELDTILQASVRGTTWVTNTAFVYDQVVFPTVRNGHKYRVITAGTSGATQPTWPEWGYVTDGTVELYEDGADYGNIYDVRRAAFAALDLKVKKKMTENTYLQDARAQASSYDYLNLVRERDKYLSVSVV